MKKLLTLLVCFAFLLSVSFVIAETDNPGIHEPGTGLENPELKEANQGTGLGLEEGEPNLIATQTQTYTNNAGEDMQIQTGTQTRLRVRDVEAHSSLEIIPVQEQNRTRLKVKLSNGNEAEIKIMPNTASETALNRLRLKVCSQENNCSIELKEVGTGTQTKAVYQLQAERQSKVFGLFRAKMQVQAQVNAENGEIVRTNKPWWSFIASEQQE